MHNTDAYKDIIDMPHPDSKKYPRMDIVNRAAQFSPFAAMVGHDAAIKETARLTEKKIELDDNEKALLDAKMQIIADALKDGKQMEVYITHFVKDALKEGGAYVKEQTYVERIDGNKRCINISGGRFINIDDVYGIDGDIFL